MQHYATVTILQCQCTKDLDPVRRRRSERDLLEFVQGFFLIILDPSIDLGLVNSLQYDAVLLP